MGRGFVKIKNVLLLATLFGGALLCVTGCAKKKEVLIRDGYVETSLEVNEKRTVEEALLMAEIQVGKGDYITPGLETKVAELKAGITIERKATVMVSDGENEKELVLVGAKVEDALSEAEMILDDNDLLNYEKGVYLQEGMKIRVIRRQKVRLEENGNTRTILTTAKTVEELLDMENITLGEKDRISPKNTKQIKEGMLISLKRVDVRKQVEYETIPFETEVKKSKNLTEGTSEVTQSGVNGKKKVTYEVTYVNGKEESRKLIKEKIVKEPITQVVTKGEKKETSGERTIVSKEKVLDCDGSGHGYYIITYSDGTVEYEEF